MPENEPKTVVSNYFYNCVFKEPVPIILKQPQIEEGVVEEKKYRELINKISKESNCEPSLVEYIIKLYEESIIE